jgi:exopolysaccharide production protein ExoY
LIGLMYGLERFVAIFGMVVLAPVALAVAVTIFKKSRRSPLVRHLRVGWMGAPLPMLKFRTMWTDRESPGSFFQIESVSGPVPLSKTADDSRVTNRFAAFCRRYSLDELPQLYHVARGEMSFVGPRPITEAELREHYEDCSELVVSVRPGLTGLWQLKGRNNLTYAERRELDLDFVRTASASLYLSILARSVPKVLNGGGA